MHGVLDLDHLGTEAAEQLGGVRESLHLLRRQHPDAVQRLALVRPLAGDDLTQSHLGEGRGGKYPARQCED